MAKLPKPMNLKAEKLEEENVLTSMSHFIDDRLELTKQIFATLKSKTILNLAPDFLKKKDVDTIEEMCLEELLCLSTKRLRSIIESTRCPTDTESSGDSDVERKEEHVSLEEISSDSEVGGGSSKTARNKSKLKKKAKTTAAGDETAGGGQISVLELLELQARARAIRSQLAMEPVTKIEVDSDDNHTQDSSQPPEKKKKTRAPKSVGEKEKTDKAQQPTKPDKSSKSRKEQANAATKPLENASKPTADAPKTSNKSAIPDATRQTITNNTAATPCQEPSTTKKIKLRRNFRNAHKAEDKEKQCELPAEEVKKEKKSGSRSASPDVVPILSEPITFCISDSDEDVGKQPQTAVAAEERHAKTEQQNGESNRETNQEKHKNQYPAPPVEEQNPVEAEEGEIMDVDMAPKAQVDAVAVVRAPSEEPVKDTAKPDAKSKQHKKSKKKSRRSASHVESANTKQSSSDPSPAPQSDNSQAESIAKAAPNFDEEDPNDDVISLEGGDLENEMTEHLAQDTSTKDSTSTAKSNTNANDETKQDEQIISLDSSENEDTSLTDSWHTRYLKSDKVNKVLAVSRLGKRMRDKIKSSKRQAKAHEATPEDSKAKEESFVSKHEEGSLEQYKELIELNTQKDST